MAHKCDGCKFTLSYDDGQFGPFGVCGKEGNLIEAEKAYNAEVCPFNMQAIIKDTPATDVVPVRRGAWIIAQAPLGKAKSTVAFCSVCNESYIVGKQTPDEFCRNFAFCPHCGAKMDLED